MPGDQASPEFTPLFLEPFQLLLPIHPPSFWSSHPALLSSRTTIPAIHFSVSAKFQLLTPDLQLHQDVASKHHWLAFRIPTCPPPFPHPAFPGIPPTPILLGSAHNTLLIVYHNNSLFPRIIWLLERLSFGTRQELPYITFSTLSDLGEPPSPISNSTSLPELP